MSETTNQNLNGVAETGGEVATPSCLPQIRNRDFLCLPNFRFRIWGRCPSGR